MKFLKTPALIAVTSLVLLACSRDDGTAEQVNANPLLSTVPAGTPYVYANFEPTPADVIDAFMLRAAPSLLAVQTVLDDLEIQINTDDPDEMKEGRLLSALINEFKGKLNREGLTSLGLSLDSHFVAYGMGAFPVARVSLSDPDKLRSAIGRIESDSGIPFTARSLNGVEYWKISGNQTQVGIYVAILPDHLAVALLPSAMESDMLPAFLGQVKPAGSPVAQQLAAINKEHGFSGLGSGFVDLQRLASEFLDESSVTATFLAGVGHYKPGELGDVCRSEINGLVAKAPRLLAGTTELTANTLGISYLLELQPDLATQLTGLVADVPVADRGPGKVVTASLGLNLGKLRNFLVEQFTTISTAPFQCQYLQDLNVQANTMLAQLNQPMPPFINNLKGFRMSLDEIDYANFSPEKAKGMFVLEVEKPQMLIGMAQMFIPGLDGLNLEAGADPVALPQELLSIATPEMRVYAAMGSNSIGVSTGDSGQAALAAFMEQEGNSKGVFFSAEFDMAAQMEIQNRMQEQFASASLDDAAEQAKYNELQKNIQDSYKAWLGRSRVEVGFTDKGLRIDSSMTFK